MSSPKLSYTPVSDIPGIVAAARAAFSSGATRSLAWRRAQLMAISRLLLENEAAVLAALQADLRKPLFEGAIHEVELVAREARHAASHLSGWAAPESVQTPSMFLPASSYVVKDPLGVVCIITPWNFPFNLPLNSLIAALAAGNAVVLKPSEHAPTCAALLAELLPRYVDAAAVRLVQGGVAETTALLAQRFDSIMYTGSPAVGKIVMAAAAKHLTPVLLELGGKNPVIVDATANLRAAAQAIVRARCTNAGQICIGAEYVLVEAAVEEALIAELKAAVTRIFGEQPKASPSFGRIVNRAHWARISGLIKSAGGAVVAGGETDESQLYIAPTIIRGAVEGAPISCEEVFGPVLCVRPVKDLGEAIAVVNAGEKPLACYLFSNSSAAQARVLAETSAGGMTINDTLNHLCIPELPFGGVGNSGMGAYHGKNGFDAFTHRKAVFHTGRLNLTGIFADPPYGERQAATLRTIMAITPYRLLPLGVKDALILGLAAAVVALAGRVAGRW